MATNFIRLAAEQAPNAEGGANTVSSVTFDIPATGFTMNPNPELLERGSEMRGVSGEMPHLGVSTYSPELSLPTRVYPGILGELLLLACGSVTTTAGNGVITDPDSTAVPNGAYRHVFAWKTGAVPQTGQILHGNVGDGLFYKGQGVGIDSLEFKPDGGVWTIDAALKALYWAIVSDPSVTPSFETVKPFLDGQMTLTWLSGGGTIKDFSFGIQNNLELGRSRTTASQFPDMIEFADEQPWQQLTGSIGKQTFDADDWAALIAGTTFAATIKLTSGTQYITGSYPYQLWIEMPACQYTGGDIDESKNARKHGATFPWAARYDTVTSKWATITLVNATAELATYA